MSEDLVHERPREESARRRLAQLWQLVKFGTVGGVGVVVNVAVFNGLWLTVFNPSHASHGPILATVIATLCAILVNWLGNRYWAFAGERQRNTLREGIEFFGASLLGMLVPLACIGVSRYILELHSLLADNIASNVVGLILGTILRFFLYKFWVYSPRRAQTCVRLSGVNESGSADSHADEIQRRGLARRGSQSQPSD
jgi:putative flippase GtrA